MEKKLNSKIKLNSGNEMPVLGLGTYKLTDEKTVHKAVESALEIGYRLIDTASMYNNEEFVGDAIQNSNIPREEIFVTTKLDNDQHGYDNTLKAFDISLKKLKLDYIDLYLIHWPVTGLRNESWKALEKLYEQNVCKSVGVSNYTIRHLSELFENSNLKPAVNQVEFNPFNYQKKLLDFCKENGIQLEGYTPLARSKRFDHPEVKKIAEKHSKTPAQILIRWAIQQNVIIIPKSSNPERIKENSNVFDLQLDDEDMKKLNSLNENLRFAMDPAEIK